MPNCKGKHTLIWAIEWFYASAFWCVLFLAQLAAQSYIYVPFPFKRKINVIFYSRIIDGFEALDDLEKMAVNPKTYRPLTEAKITSVTIHANPLAG